MAAEAFRRLGPARVAERAWIACATAHPYKFAEVVEPLIGAALKPSPALAAILGRAARSIPIKGGLNALAEAISQKAAIFKSEATVRNERYDCNANLHNVQQMTTSVAKTQTQ